MRKKTIIFILGVIISLSVLGVNFWLIYPWFLGKGPANIGSIEVSYVSMARFIRDFSPHLSFAPYWYFGFPFHLFYTPLLPFLEAILNKLTDIPLWQAYRVITGVGFGLAPVSLFLFAWYLTKKIIPGILAALSYSFLPTIFYFVLSSKEVAADMISQGFFDPRRLVILARWGEGPHLFSLIFLPLAGLFYLRTLQTKKLSDVFLAALFTGLTAMTNAVGFYALVLLFLPVFFSATIINTKTFGETIKLSILTAIFSYGLIAFWYNFSFVSSFFGEGGGVVKNYLAIFPWGLFILLWIIVALFFFFQKVVRERAVIVASLWFLILFLIVYVYYTSAPPEFSEQRLEFAPQALRLMTEVDMAFSLFLAALFGAFLSFLEKKGLLLKILGNLVGLTLTLGLLVYGVSYIPHGQKAVSGEVDLTKTGEYEIANWLKDHIDQKRGERVYVAGNYGFYLNYFTNVWQLRGGLYQAKTHFWPEHIFYQINHGQNKEIALAWLKAANIKYIVVNTAPSREFYKEFKYPEKFADLKVVYEDKGDIVYEVPLRESSPVKVINLREIGGLFPPKKADDKEPLLAYADLLDQSQQASLEVVNNDLYKIKVKVEKGEGILVQMTFDQGFKAYSNLGRVRITKDPLGFILLTPEKEGEHEITLKHGKSWKIWLGYLTTLLTIVFLGYLFVGRKGKLSFLR